MSLVIMAKPLMSAAFSMYSKRRIAPDGPRLSALLNQELASGEADTAYLTRSFSLHGQGASRLARLLRLQQAQASTLQDQLSQAIHQALDELSKEWGLEL